MSTSPGSVEEVLPPRLALAFAPLHKRALGTAIGVALAVAIGGVTLIHVVHPAPDASRLYLLGEYFYGYTPSVAGVFVGAAWGFFVGFVAGWFLAFSRNLILALALFWGRTREELAATRDFLDHI